jgi:hypothetical protein
MLATSSKPDSLKFANILAPPVNPVFDGALYRAPRDLDSTIIHQRNFATVAFGFGRAHGRATMAGTDCGACADRNVRSCRINGTSASVKGAAQD